MGILGPDDQPASARDVPLDAVRAHVESERAEVGRLSGIREIVFGAQDGLVSTLAVVAAVAAATDDRITVLIAGLASALAGIFSMSAGEYLGGRSEARVLGAVRADEEAEVRSRPLEAEAEVALTFLEEGMDPDDAYEVARILGRNPGSLLSTMVARELGVVVDDHDTAPAPVRAALLMGAAFAAGAAVPLVPFLLGGGTGALIASSVVTGIALFALGGASAVLAGQAPWRAGFETLGLAALAGVAGYLFGQVLPTLLGVPAA